MAPSRDDPFALQVTSDLMVKLTTIPKPVTKCQKPKPKQTQQSPTISHPKSNSQIEQNEERIEIPTTSDKIVLHDSHKMPKIPPQTQLESLSNTHTRGHETKPQPSIHSSQTKQEIEKKTEIQTKGGPHTTKENKVKEPIGGKKTESAKTIDKQRGLDTTQHSEWERQENIENPMDDPTMDHKFQKPNMSKPDCKIKRQGGLKDLTELEDMHNKSPLQKNLSQTAKNETGSPNSQHKNKHSPQKEVNLDGNTRQQSKHIGQPTNSYDKRKLNTNAFQENEHEKKMEVQKNTKIEPKGSTPIENSTSLELGETVLGMKKTDKSVKAHDNKAIENEQMLDKGKNSIQQVASEVEHELARRGILHAPKQCVYPSGPQLEAKTDAKSDAKTNRRHNTPNASGEGEIWRRLGHEDSVDSSQRVPQTQLNETTRLETGKQFLQQIESHISKEKKLDRRTDIGASIIQRATLQATMMDLEESTEEESEVLEYESPPRSPSSKFPVYQFPPMIADQRYTWPRKESLLTPKAYDERVDMNQRENHIPQSRQVDKEIPIPKLKKVEIQEVQIPKTKKVDDKEIYSLGSKQVDQRPQAGQSRVPQQQIFCLQEKDACIDCYKKNAQKPLECADAVRLYKECSQRIQKVAKGAYGGTISTSS